MSQLDLKNEPKYWGVYDFRAETRLQFKFGGLLMDLACSDKDWLLQYEVKTSDTAEAPSVCRISTEDVAWQLANQQRLVSDKIPQQFSLYPTMPDRPIVCRATTTVLLLPKEQISLYVTVPLWLQLSISDVKKPLLDVPTECISETWFGSNSREGVMSYALRMSEQLDIKPSEKQGMRAAIEIRIKNESNEILSLDKVNVPAPNLALYVDETGQFCTHRITMVREQDENATLTIDNVMSHGLVNKDLTFVCGPRDDLGQHKITKALSTLFG